MHKPKHNINLACCNFIEDPLELRDFALSNGFSGIDWSFFPDKIPQKPAEISKWIDKIKSLAPLEVRFHSPLPRTDIGHKDPDKRSAAMDVYERLIRLCSLAGGRFLTIHVGLGRDSTKPLSWELTIKNLARLVELGRNSGIHVCLENLAWGWSAKPNLFEKLVRETNARVTIDIGHIWACESITTQQYSPEDFIVLHRGRIENAHIYHTEIPGKGHIPPVYCEQVSHRLALLLLAGCKWWVIEIRDKKELLNAKRLITSCLQQIPPSMDVAAAEL